MIPADSDTDRARPADNERVTAADSDTDREISADTDRVAQEDGEHVILTDRDYVWSWPGPNCQQSGYMFSHFRRSRLCWLLCCEAGLRETIDGLRVVQK